MRNFPVKLTDSINETESDAGEIGHCAKESKQVSSDLSI